MNTNHTAVTPPTPTSRLDGLAAAREVLLVKGGRYAERPLDVVDLVTIAEYIQHGPSALPSATDWARFKATIQAYRKAVGDLHIVKGAE